MSALTDKSHSVIGYLATSGGGIAERVQYRAYGTPILAATGDADGNGTVAFSDNSAVLAGFNGVVGNPYPGGAYTARADVNQDGAITFADTTFIFANFGKSQRYDRVSDRGCDASANGVPWGEEGYTVFTGSGSVIGYAGSVWDPEAQLCLMRHRWHDPNLARWLTRDPAGYVDGMSLYVYVKGNPLVYVDPFGLRVDENQLPGSGQDLVNGVDGAASYVGSRADNMAVGGVSGAATGGATGALVGSVVPGGGTMVGAGVGAIGGFIGGVVTGLLSEDGESCATTAKNAALGGVVDGITGGVGSKFVTPAKAGAKALGAADEIVDAGQGVAKAAKSEIDAAARLKANKAGGDAFRDEVADALSATGRGTEKEVVKDTPFGPRKIDIEVKKDGRTLGGVEAKKGASPYKPDQRAKDQYLKEVHDYPVNLIRDKTPVPPPSQSQ